MSPRVEIGGRCQIQTDEWLITIAEVQAQCHRSLGQSSIGWSWTCTNMWLSPPLLSRQDLYYLGESIHLEIEKDMAFLFRKVMSLGRHGLKELLLVAGNIFRKFYVQFVLNLQLADISFLRQDILPWLFCCTTVREMPTKRHRKMVGATRAARVPSVPKTGVQKLLYHAPI